MCSLTIQRNWDEFLNFYAFRSEIDSQKNELNDAKEVKTEKESAELSHLR